MLDVFTLIEQNVGVLLLDLRFEDASALLVVVAIPVAAEGILDNAGVVAEAERSKMVDDATQVILAADVLGLQEIVVLHVP